jgi:hypothetical protein
MSEERLNEVTPEDPGVVKGGPLDPTAPEGQPPEGDGLTPAVEPQSATLYKGLTGDLKTSAEWVSYTKNLEDMLAQRMVTQAVQPVPPPIVPVVPQGPTTKEKFSELIFSKPEEAYDLTVNEAKRQMREEMEAEKRAVETKKQFWVNFYTKHQDLKNFEDVVQSIVKAKAAEISQIRTEAECAEFLSRESRRLVDTVKKQLGVTEVAVPSGTAIAFGGNRELPTRQPVNPQAPKNFITQVRDMRPRLVGKK